MDFFKTFESYNKKKPTELNSAFWNWFGESKVVTPDKKPKIVHHGSGDIRFTSFSHTSDIGFHFGNYRQAYNMAELKGETSGGNYTEYGETSPYGVGSFYIKIENPIYLPDLEFWRKSDFIKLLDEDYFKEFGGSDLWDHRLSIIENLNTPELKKVFEVKNLDKDVDGVIYHNEYEGTEIVGRVMKMEAERLWSNGLQSVVETELGITFDETEGKWKKVPNFRISKTSYIVFDNKNIKSVFNDGTWNSSSENFMK